MSGQAYINSGEFQDLMSFASLSGISADWSNAGNAQISDDAYATVVLTDAVSDSDRLACTGLPRKIPDGVTVQGIAMRWERRQSVGADVGALILLTKDGINNVGTAKTDSSASMPTTDAYITKGGAADLWGTTWTPAEINANTFGVFLSVNDGSAAPFSNTFYVDHVQIAVYYS